MNTRVLISWLLIICPIGMMVIFAGLEPLIMGSIDESLAPREEALMALELSNDKGLVGYILNVSGVILMIGAISGLALLGKSLKGDGAALGGLSSLIFTALLAIPVISMGLSLMANETFTDGYKDVAVSMEVIGDAVFSGIPLFWGLGYVLLGLGMLLGKGPLPVVLAWILFLGGLIMLPGPFIGFAGFLIFAILTLVVVISGVFLIRQSD